MTEGARLDYVFWHPRFDEIISFLSSTRFDTKELASDYVAQTPIISGKTPEDYIFPMKGVPFIGARNIHDNQVDLAECTYLDTDTHERMKSSKITANDVLITMAGAIGRCAVYSENAEANISQAVARLQPNMTNINPHYLSYYLNSRFGQIQFERNRHDVNQPNINTTEIGHIRSVVPPRPIQDQIVRQLHVMEQEIVNIRTKTEKTTSELLNTIPSRLSLNLPSQKHDYYFKFPEQMEDRLDFVWNTPLTEAIRGYLTSRSAIKLRTVVEDEKFEYGMNAYGKEHGKIPFVNIENLDLDGRIHSEGIRFLDDAPEAKQLHEDELLISRSRTVGTCATVTEKENGFTFGSYILRFKVKKDWLANSVYLANFINSPLGQAQVTYLQTGARDTERGGGNNINPTNLGDLLVVLPLNDKDSAHIKKAIEDQLREIETYNKQHEEKLQEYTGAFERVLRSQ
jgi:type I restriction enzyme S subunit